MAPSLLSSELWCATPNGSRQSQEPDDHKEDDETTRQGEAASCAVCRRRPRLMRVRLPQHVVTVEVPWPKAHRVQPVLPSMSVSGHRLAMSLFSAASPTTTCGGPQVTRRSRLKGMVRRVYGSTPTSPWAWTDVRFRPLFSWKLVPRLRTPYGSDRPVRAGPSGPTRSVLAEGDQPTESVLRWATSGEWSTRDIACSLPVGESAGRLSGCLHQKFT